MEAPFYGDLREKLDTMTCIGDKSAVVEDAPVLLQGGGGDIQDGVQQAGLVPGALLAGGGEGRGGGEQGDLQFVENPGLEVAGGQDLPRPAVDEGQENDGAGGSFSSPSVSGVQGTATCPSVKAELLERKLAGVQARKAMAMARRMMVACSLSPGMATVRRTLVFEEVTESSEETGNDSSTGDEEATL